MFFFFLFCPHNRHTSCCWPISPAPICSLLLVMALTVTTRTHTHTLGSRAISKVRLLTEGTARVTKRGEQETREWGTSGGCWQNVGIILPKRSKQQTDGDRVGEGKKTVTLAPGWKDTAHHASTEARRQMAFNWREIPIYWPKDASGN